MTDRKKIKIKDLPVYDSSPFRKLLFSSLYITPCRGGKTEQRDLHDDHGVHYTMNVKVGEYDFYWRDSQRFNKIYEEGVDVLSDLSRPATKLFWCITKEMSPNRDWVRVDFKLFSDFSNIKSRSSYYEAITDLVEKNIIALAKTPLFYVNPMFVFNGDRTQLMEGAEEEYYERGRQTKGRITKVKTD